MSIELWIITVAGSARLKWEGMKGSSAAGSVRKLYVIARLFAYVARPPSWDGPKTTGMSYRWPRSGLNMRTFLSSWVGNLCLAASALLSVRLLGLHGRDVSQQFRWLLARDRH